MGKSVPLPPPASPVCPRCGTAEHVRPGAPYGLQPGNWSCRRCRADVAEFLSALAALISEWRGRLTYADPPSREEWDEWYRALVETPESEPEPPSPDKRSPRDLTLEHAFENLERARAELTYLRQSEKTSE